jgi:hypothetical protein
MALFALALLATVAVEWVTALTVHALVWTS